MALDQRGDVDIELNGDVIRQDLHGVAVAADFIGAGHNHDVGRVLCRGRGM